MIQDAGPTLLQVWLKEHQVNESNGAFFPSCRRRQQPSPYFIVSSSQSATVARPAIYHLP